MLEKIVDRMDWYFEPKGFEKISRLYEALGVKLWSKYWPNGGSKFSGSVHDPHSKSGLESYLNLTKVLETTHLLLTIPFFQMTLLHLLQEEYFLAGRDIALNIIANGYPIMSMRYNRDRVSKILQKRYKI